MENKTHKKFNVIDIIIILMIGLVVVISVKLFAPKTVVAENNGTPVKYTIELERQKDGFEEQIIIGEKLYDNLVGYEIGTITGYTVNPFLMDAPDHDNDKIIMAPVEGYNSIYIEVEAYGTITNEAIKIGNYEIYIGSFAYVKSKLFAGGGYVVKLDY